MRQTVLINPLEILLKILARHRCREGCLVHWTWDLVFDLMMYFRVNINVVLLKLIY